jgi:hypothetical protein
MITGRSMNTQHATVSRLRFRPTAKGLAWLAILAFSAIAWMLIGWAFLTFLG